MQQTADLCLRHMLKNINEKMFPGVELQVSGNAVGSAVKISVLTKKDEPRFAEVKQKLEELESVIAYPEISFVIRQLD